MDILLIANQTLASRKVFERIVWYRKEHPSLHVHVVVPATPSENAPSVNQDVHGRPVVDYLAIDTANARLKATLSSIEALDGVTASGELGAPDPLTAMRNALPQRAWGQVVLATLPSGASRWLRMDLVHRARRATDIPVDHVIGDEDQPKAEHTPVTWQTIGVSGDKTELHVLLVDDNEADLELTTVALEQAPIDCDIRVARDGQGALNRAKQRTPDLILLDLSMPGVSGFQTLELLAADDDLKGVPVVILTTSDRPEDRERAHELGASAYVVKENDFNRFEAVLHGVLAEVVAD